MEGLSQRVVFDPERIRRYDLAGPRYTSYPTAPQFDPEYGEAQYREWARRSNLSAPQRPLSLYVHIPFCDTVCFYCACNKVVTGNHSRAGPYMERLLREVELQGALFDRERSVDQLAWGGGTPTFLSDAQIQELMAAIGRHFRLRDDDRGEYSIEVDPRRIRGQTLTVLRALGFNRISLGIQDFDPQVQRAVNRIQGEAQTFAVLESARRAGFHSVSVDLMYGLPFQNVERFARTLDKVIDAAPDRLSVFNYAHLPERFKPQRRIRLDDLPPPAEKLAILRHTVERLEAAGYVYIGMDHFARPGDELARAQRAGTLYRNFQGYSTHADCDLVGLGVSAISQVAESYSQNARDLPAYYERLDAGRLAVVRGVGLSPDDRLRRAVIMGLLCHAQVSYAAIEARYGIVFPEYFRAELERLAVMEADGLVEVTQERIRVTPVGRLLARNVAMIFDGYLRSPPSRDRDPVRYSRVI
ncbi:MAG: oxygen-independent coproporphyrinogen III oxidase [Gammaproteobacteria bacterium]